jgi:hypothetical protein
VVSTTDGHMGWQHGWIAVECVQRLSGVMLYAHSVLNGFSFHCRIVLASSVCGMTATVQERAVTNCCGSFGYCLDLGLLNNCTTSNQLWLLGCVSHTLGACGLASCYMLYMINCGLWGFAVHSDVATYKMCHDATITANSS